MNYQKAFFKDFLKKKLVLRVKNKIKIQTKELKIHF